MPNPDPHEVPEYNSADLQIDWPEGYEPPYPINQAEWNLLQKNRKKK